MVLHHQVRPELPPLAWLLEIGGAAENHRLICGTGVARGENAFFEGAWPGAFGALDFAGRAEVFGSGGVLGPRGWTIVAPSHTLESVFCCREGSRVTVSNALPFLLAHRGDALDPGFAAYHNRLFRILHGLDALPIRFPSRKSREILAFFYHNVSIGPGLEIAALRKPEAPHFGDYAQYRDYLIATAQATLRNAADPARPSPYLPIATVSQGYDLPAAAVIARAGGCRETITQSLARRAFGVVDPDSGEAVASALGMGTALFDRKDYLARTGLDAPEAEFLSHGLEGLDVNFLSFEPVLRHRVLFTGFHGDAVWDKSKVPNAAIRRGDLSGASLGEFRRRVDFLHIPVPFIGVLRHAEIQALAFRPEMAAYTLGNDYDRPVPRRILEEAGVPRKAFGMAKKAVAVMFFGLQIGLDEKMAELSRRALSAFAAGWHPSAGVRLRLLRNAAVSRGVDLVRLILKKTRLADRLGLGKPAEKLLARLDELSLDTPETVLALHWAMARMIARYSGDAAARQPPPRTG